METSIEEADEIHGHVKQVFASIAADESLTDQQRDNARNVLNRIASMELAILEMLARDCLPCAPDKRTLQ